MKIGIYGYGNLGRGIESAVKYNPDIELVGVFTRRDPASVKTVSGAKVYSQDRVFDFKDEIDVLVLCGGSATDLPEMTPALAKHFNLIDSFDTHAKIPEHFRKTDESAAQNGHVALISAGWDPGLFSIARLYSASVLPAGKDYTFWGKGISQGHSDAIRRIEGVVDARQYTIPKSNAIDAVRRGECPELSTGDKHVRECFVVAADGADKGIIEKQIKEMPNYFSDYETTVHFISREELKREHSGMPHGGSVIRNGKTGFEGEHGHTVEFSLKLDSNPEFTASVIIAYARAVDRLAKRGDRGCKTVFDIAPADLSTMSREEIITKLL